MTTMIMNEARNMKLEYKLLSISRASNVSALPQHLQSTNSLASSNSSTTVGCDSTMTENNAAPQGDQQVMVFCTEKSAAVYSLPSQRQMYMQTINESSNVVAANIINFGGVKFTPCLVTYTADGFIKAFSLPSLRPMLDMYFTANKDPRIALTMSFSNYGHGLYMANATEVCKYVYKILSLEKKICFFRQIEGA